MDASHDTIAVVDFGGQYAHLIASKLRRLGFHSIIRDPSDPIEAFNGLKGIILSGSPALKSQGEGDDWNTAIFGIHLPIMGLCFGHQIMSAHYGGKVESHSKEYGPATLARAEDKHPLFEGVDPKGQVFMSHGDSVVKLADGFVELAYTIKADGSPHRYGAVANDALRRYGLQFHPEVDDTVQGEVILRNYAERICNCRQTWDMNRFLQDEVAALKVQCEGKDVFLLASGGVDSTVCAWLLHEALGPERLHLLHIDNGFMRLKESEEVLAAFRDHDVSRHVHFVDASEDFLKAVGESAAPEKKRMAIGNTFIDVFQVEANKLGLSRFLLAQGTIYPDTIESGGTKRADVIKTHHNRVPIIQEMIEQGKVVEPLRELYKTEVRELGAKLGVPKSFLERHPFPGPGLGVRLLCNSTAEIPATFHPTVILEKAAPIAQRFGYTALPLPVRSVGVKGDLRCYEHPLLLIAKDWDWKSACATCVEIFRDVPNINRCILLLGSKVEVEGALPIKALTTRERLESLRIADQMVMDGLRRHNLYNIVWQCPTVLVPTIATGKPKGEPDNKKSKTVDGELVVIRPILSERAMTAMPADLPKALCDELVQEILSIEGVGWVALDVTPKPPGTIEWE